MTEVTFLQDENNNDALHQEQEPEVGNPNNDKKVLGEEEVQKEQKEEVHEELQPQGEEQIHEEVKNEEQELIMQAGDQRGQQIPEAPAAEQEQGHEVPVHLGQPEI